MKTYEHECVQNWFVEAENGDRQECRKGQVYTLCAPDDEGNVMVFSGYWVMAPSSIFKTTTDE